MQKGKTYQLISTLMKIRFINCITSIMVVILLFFGIFSIYHARKTEKQGASLSKEQRKVILKEVIFSKELLLVKKSNPEKYKQIFKYLNDYCYFINKHFRTLSWLLYRLSFICFLLAVFIIAYSRLYKKNIYLERDIQRSHTPTNDHD